MSAGPRPTLPPTPSQTIGPFFAFALPYEAGPVVVPPGTEGGIVIEGRLFDGAGAPVTDGLIESWQADPQGRFVDPGKPPAAGGFLGFGRVATDPEGRFELHTVKPGPTPGPGGAAQAPHVVLSVFARGLLARLVTRVYFGDEGAANEVDPVLSTVPGGESARRTLIAAPVAGGYRFDIRLQGEDETVFFSI